MWSHDLKKTSLCAFFAQEIACLCWPTLVKGRHYVHSFCKKKCMFSLAYPVEKGVTMCIFCKKSGCPCWPNHHHHNGSHNHHHHSFAKRNLFTEIFILNSEEIFAVLIDSHLLCFFKHLFRFSTQSSDQHFLPSGEGQGLDLHPKADSNTLSFVFS